MKHILDEFDHIEASVPGLKGRLDRSRLVIAGHSLGGHTAAMLMGARLTSQDGAVVNMAEPRFKAGVLIAAPGNGGADLSAFAAEHYPELGLDFSGMETAGLVVAGDEDASPYLTVRGADWRADPYFLSTGPKSLLTLFGGEHGLGGISGYDAGETTDENPERVAVVQRLTWAYIRSVLYPGDTSWSKACSILEDLKDIGRVESK
jgi:pimeloyl-ACP methyl ester carboxylesterase